MVRIADVQAAFAALEGNLDGRPYVNRWNDAGPNSLDQRKAYQQFREDYSALRDDIWPRNLEGLEVVSTHEALNNPHTFPTGSLDYIRIGMSKEMPKADLARALEKIFAPPRYPKKDNPFTADNVERIFDYLRESGSRVYDNNFIADEGEKDEKYEELFAEARKPGDSGA